MRKIKTICTIGPSSLNEEILNKLEERDVDFFRVNLSHTDKDKIESVVIELKKHNVPIILDTEGSQVRSANKKDLVLLEGQNIKIFEEHCAGDSDRLVLNPVSVLNALREGDLISIDFNSALLKIYNVKTLREKKYIECKVLIGGLVGLRKAVHIDSPTFKLPSFSEKDLSAVKIAKKYGIKHFTLSFMEDPSDVKAFKKLLPGVTVFSKIESKKGLENFLKIAKESNGVLIDRGDLSHQVPLERIPLIQKYVISKCREMGKEVFIATNTLEQMSFSLKPNRAEVNDIINTLLDGATGIALTKETAAGKYPVETVNMLKVLISQFSLFDFSENPNKKEILNKIEKENYLYSSKKIPGFLIRPHGGVLVDRVFRGDSSKLKVPGKKIFVGEETLMDIEQIAIGAFSPLEGFLNEDDFNSVVDKMRMKSGVVWPIPITLNVSKNEQESFKIGEEVSLASLEDKNIYAILKIEDKFRINKNDVALKLYGTESLEHPGVKKLMESSEYCLGGKIILIRRRNSEYNLYELTPLQVRKIFIERGWSKVIGFHTRNVVHRGHEFIQMSGLKESACDGLFVHPIIGRKKEGDFSADIIVKTYERMIDEFYPVSKVIFSAFSSYSRYAGPREAIFTALVRKNFGCSHFIVGRDHTGVGNFYGPNDSHKIFDRFTKEELGIVPVIFDKIFYSTIEKGYVHEKDSPNHPEDKKLHISGTQAREMLKKGIEPPEWFMRPEISRMIIEKIKKGEKVFF